MSDKMEVMRSENNGEFPSYAWPGGYPVFYLTKDCILCPACANKEDDPTSVLDWAINWEDTDLFCEECSNRIESAYAED